MAIVKLTNEQIVELVRQLAIAAWRDVLFAAATRYPRIPLLPGSESISVFSRKTANRFGRRTIAQVRRCLRQTPSTQTR
jgi:hypothetical protein